MKLETFFEKFDQFADAPDAVAKMRELLLQLAVQGKLVAQKRSDGNAAQLLAAISKERDTRAAKLRTPDEPTSVDGNEPAFPIPSNWAWTQLGNIALQIQYGYTASADPSATEIRMLRITDIQNNRVDWPSVPGCQIESDEAEKYLLSPNDILIARTGGTIGKSFIVPDAPVKSVFASYLIRVTPPQSMAPRYLKTFLESPLYWSQLQKMSAGTGQPNVNGQALGRLEIPLPSLAEQKRIVAKVDELMALCNRLEAQQQERETRHAALARASLARFADAPTPASLHFLFHPSYAIPPADLRKSILTLAVQGLLVPHDAESADWETRKLKELTTKIGSGSTPSGGKESYQETGVPLIRSMNVHFGGFVRDGLAFLNNEQAEKLKNVTVKADDVLLNITGASIGRVATAPKDMEGARVNQHVCILRPTAEIIPPFLELFLASPVVQNLIDDVQVGATREALTKAMIEQFEIPVPSLAEQRRIVAKVEQLMALVDALETQLAASSATAANLLSALVTELTSRKGGDDET